MNSKSSPLCEFGDLTGALQKTFLMRFELHDFKINESYEASRNGTGFNRKLEFSDRKSQTRLIGQDVNLPCSWVVTVRCQDGHASVSLQLQSSLMNDDEECYVYCKFKISIVDKDDDILYSRTWKSWNTARKIYVGEEYTLPNFISLNDLADNEAFYVAGNILRLNCEGVMYTGFKHTPILRVDGHPINLTPTTSMSAELWGNTDFCDIQLITEDGKAFPAHKLILFNASLIWRNLISSITKGGDNDKETVTTLHLDNVNMTELVKMLQFIYTGDVDQEWTNLGEASALMTVASSFELSALKAHCFHKILGALTLSQFTDVVTLFSRHSAGSKLLETLHRFFLRNQDKIIYQAKFREFSKDNTDIFLGLVCCGPVVLSKNTTIDGIVTQFKK